ncbi:MAG: small multi-drug export protein [bacterium]
MDGLILLSIGERVASAIVTWMQGVPPWLIVVVIAMLPIVELRAAIPVAIAALHMHWAEAVVFSILGNMIPIPFVLWLLDPIRRLLSRWTFFNRLFEKIFQHALKRSKALQHTESIGLILFVAIPLPATGAWTGSLVAYLLRFPRGKSLIYILYGVIIASIVVTLATIGTLGAVHLIG